MAGKVGDLGQRLPAGHLGHAVDVEKFRQTFRNGVGVAGGKFLAPKDDKLDEVVLFRRQDSCKILRQRRVKRRRHLEISDLFVGRTKFTKIGNSSSSKKL